MPGPAANTTAAAAAVLACRRHQAPADRPGEEKLLSRLSPSDLEGCLDLRHYMQVSTAGVGVYMSQGRREERGLV